MTDVDVFNYLLDFNYEQKNLYNLYQNILYVLQNKNYQLLETILKSEFG